MSPNFRRAAHQALDILLDALAAEQEMQPVKAKKRRGPAVSSMPPPTRPLTPEEQAQLDRQLTRAGFKKTG